MPALDRRIVVQRTQQSVNQFGEPSETTTDLPLWASRRDASALRQLQEGGSWTEGARAYVVRWRADLAAAEPGELNIVDGEFTATCSNIAEVQGPRDERRRFLMLETVGVVG